MSITADARARLTRPGGPPGGPGVVLLHDALGVSPAIEGLSRHLVDRGFVVVVPELRGEPGALVPDAAALEEVRAAQQALEAAGADRGRLYVVGVGLGGTLAMIAPSAVVGLAGAVAFGGRLVYPTLSAARPVQPMDLLPGVRAPLQLHYGAADPSVPPHHVEQLRERLMRLGLPHQVLVYPAAGEGLIEAGLPGHEAAAARTALARATRFLQKLAGGVQ